LTTNNPSILCLLYIYIHIHCSASLVIFPVIVFKFIETFFFTFVPLFTGVWGLIATFQSNWFVQTLDLKSVPPTTVALAGSLVALASYGVYAVGARCVCSPYIVSMLYPHIEVTLIHNPSLLIPL
jgi:hypothetical protein